VKISEFCSKEKILQLGSKFRDGKYRLLIRLQKSVWLRCY